MSIPPALAQSRYTFEDFEAIQALPQNADGWLEFYRGMVYKYGLPYPQTDDGRLSMPTGHLHNWVISRLMELLILFTSPRGLGRVYGDGATYRLSDGSVVIPNTSFVAEGREGPVDSAYIPFAPDLAVEVISPSNTRDELWRKTNLYLDNGVGLVWLIDPVARTVEVYTRTGDHAHHYQRLTEPDILDGGEVLPGFTAALPTLFPSE